MRVLLQPACILHRRPYRETSLILDLFTSEFGRRSLVARGVRKLKSRWAGLLEPFQLLLVSWSGRGEMGTLLHIELQTRYQLSSGPTLRAAFYLNELIIRLLAKHDPYPEFFRQYWISLTSLSFETDHEQVLRVFERELLAHLGYGVITDKDVDAGRAISPNQRYYYNAEYGPSSTRAKGCPIHGASLLALGSGRFSSQTERDEAKRLMRYLLRIHLGDRPLGSRSLFLPHP